MFLKLIVQRGMHVYKSCWINGQSGSLKIMFYLPNCDKGFDLNNILYAYGDTDKVLFNMTY